MNRIGGCLEITGTVPLQKYQNIKCQMIKCLIMEYKRSTFQLGLQARNVNKSEKNQQRIVTTKRKQRGDDKR